MPLTQNSDWIESKDGVLKHRTAKVDELAQVGKGVQIGPDALVERGAVLQDKCRLDRDAVVRSGALVGNAAQVEERACLIENSYLPPGGILSPGETLTGSAIVIIGAPFPLTATDRGCRIGCTFTTYENWLAKDETALESMEYGVGKYLEAMQNAVRAAQGARRAAGFPAGESAEARDWPALLASLADLHPELAEECMALRKELRT